MQISFGWGIDYAPRGQSSVWSQGIVVGPSQVMNLLFTRLGLGRPASSLPFRVAQYRSLMEQADDRWYRESLLKDPWNTTRQVLTLRDAAISTGWVAPAAAESTADRLLEKESGSPRIAALQAVEALAVVGSNRDVRTTLTPGQADDLREILAALRRLASDRTFAGAWPLGINTIEVLDDFDDLPHEWQELFDLLERCGVTIQKSDPEREPAIPESLMIIRGQDEWSTAESAARLLASVPDHASVVIIAGDGTSVLDQHLHRRGLPTIGLPSASATDPSSQLLPLFLSAIIRPLDVHRIAEFLSFRARTRATDDGDQPGSAGIIPFASRTAFLNALTAEPGVTSDPDSAWMRALDDLRTAAEEAHDPSAQSSWAVAQTLDEFLRTSPPRVSDERIHINRITAAVEWLAQRLRALGGADPSRFIGLATGHIDSFLETVRLIGSDRLLIREVFDIVDACAPHATSAAHPSHAAPWTVVTDPAHVPPDTDTVVWWSSHSVDPPQHPLWDDHEIAVLESQGATITPAAQYERLHQAAALRGLSHAKNLIVFCPDTVSGAERRLHPALVQTAERFAQSRTDLFGQTPPPVDEVLSHPAIAQPVATQCSGDHWGVGDHRLGVEPVPLDAFTPPDHVSRTIDGDFTHLLPVRLSYSQIDRLLNDPLAWTLGRGLRLSTGYGVQVPTGNRMIGTLVHAVVEHLVRDGAVAEKATPTPDAIHAAFDRFVPRFASELLLPGQRTRLNALRTTTIGSLTRLFTALTDRGIQITDAEASFTAPLTLTVSGEQRDIELTGFRDLDGEFLDGRRAVVDLKWTRSPKRYRTSVDDGEAVQLSVYGRVLGASAEDGPPLTAYYMLKQGVFISSDRDLDLESTASGDPAHLWPRIQRSAEHALGRIAAGHFDALGADAYLETGTTVGAEKKPYKEAIDLIRADAEADGRLYVTSHQGYSDFTLIYGLTGDYS